MNIRKAEMKQTLPHRISESVEDNIYRFTLRTLVYQAHDQIVAYALDTDLMATGYDEEEAINKLRQTVKIFLEDAANRGTPDDLMKREAHSSFFEHWNEPPTGVDAGYLKMTIRLQKPKGVAIEPPRALMCA